MACSTYQRSLARLARRIADRQALPFEYAAWHGWETRHIGRGTYAVP